MNKKGRADPLWFAGAAILLAGVFHIFEKLPLRYLLHNEMPTLAYTALPFLSTALFVLTNGIYIALLISWMHSVYVRLLPSRSRTYILAIAGLLLVLIAVRMVKYRIFEDDPVAERLCWYIYYVPLSFIPTLFFMLGMEVGTGKRRPAERFLWLPPFVFSVLVVTNDLHHRMFIPNDGVTVVGFPGTYSYGILYYVFFGFVTAAVVGGFILLVKATADQRGRRKVAVPMGILTGMLLLWLVEYWMLTHIPAVPLPFLFPEIAVFSVLSVMESCIRNRLILCNENYANFFASLHLSAWITDDAFVPHFQTSAATLADADQMRRALREPVWIDADTKLSCRALQAGYVFYTQDESGLHRLNEKLTDSNELLAEENTLIRAENDAREQAERIQYRARLYARIAQIMYPKHMEIEKLLDRVKPGEPQFRTFLEQIAVRNAFIKRGSNMLLQNRTDALLPAMQESARYFTYMGVTMHVTDQRKESTVADAFAVYATFEEICEAVAQHARYIHVVLLDEGLRLVADCDELPPVLRTPMRIDVMHSEGLFYFTVRTGGAQV